jgi:hypothetical protein
MAEDKHEGDEHVLDVELEPEQVLDVELEEDAAAGPPAVAPAQGSEALPPVEGSLPAVDQDMIVEAEGEQLEAVCAYNRQPFMLTALPKGHGDYEVVGATQLPPGTPVGVPPGRGRQLSGVFHLSRYAGCPHCGSSGLILCEDCGSISCGATDKKSGAFLPCPMCGSKGQVTQSKSGWTVQVAGKGKGKGEGKLKGKGA